MSDQGIGSLSYERPKNSATTPTTLETEYRVSFTGNVGTVEWWMTLDPATVAEETTVTITAGATGNYYVIDVVVGADSKSYIHKQVAGDTAATIAAYLAKIIDTNPNVRATAASNVISIKAAVPGTDLLIDGTDSTTPANVVVATVAANGGTALHRKIGEASLTFSINAAGFPEITTNGKWFDGGVSPVQLVPFGPLRATSNKALDAIQTAQGVARPA